MYSPSPYPENYKTRDVYKGINIYGSIPNRYPYMYDRQPYPGLYYNDSIPNNSKRVVFNSECPQQKFLDKNEKTTRTPMVFPYTNRPWPDYTVFGKPEYYESLLDNLDLRPAYTFYKSDCYTH